MISFSVNNTLGIECPEKLKKVAALTKKLNPQYREYWADAFFYIMEGRKKDVGLSNFAATKKQEEKRLQHEKDYFINDDEVAAGYAGVLDVEAPTQFEDEVIAEADTEYYVRKFLELREYMLFKKGYDMYRLIELVRLDDQQAEMRLRILVHYEMNESQREFLKEFFSTPIYLEEIDKILK